MKKSILFTVFILTGYSLLAQTNKSLFFGASASADFGRFQDRIEITPTIAFRIVPKTYIGLGTTVAFYSTNNTIYEYDNDNTTEIETKDRIWYLGGEIFLRFVPFEQKQTVIKNIFFQSSYEAIFGNGNYKDQSGNYDYKTDNYTPFVGIGYKQPLSEKISLGILLSFKLNNEADSPYRNPMIRIALEF